MVQFNIQVHGRQWSNLIYRFMGDNGPMDTRQWSNLMYRLMGDNSPMDTQFIIQQYYLLTLFQVFLALVQALPFHFLIQWYFTYATTMRGKDVPVIT